MRALIAALASLALVACGGPDEALITEGTAAVTNPALDGLPPSIPTRIEAPLPMPDAALVFVLMGTQRGDALDLVQGPVEERFFHPVDVNVPPPELPPAPCPDCR